MEQVNFLWDITVTKEKRKWVTQRQILFCHRFALEANSFTCCVVQMNFSRGFLHAVLILLRNEFRQISLTLMDRKKPVKHGWFSECFSFIIHCAQQPLFSSENICCHINPGNPNPPTPSSSLKTHAHLPKEDQTFWHQYKVKCQAGCGAVVLKAFNFIPHHVSPIAPPPGQHWFCK